MANQSCELGSGPQPATKDCDIGRGAVQNSDYAELAIRQEGKLICSAKLVLRLVLACSCLCCLATNLSAADWQAQQSGEVQTAPVTEPRSAEHKPSGPPVPKGIRAIQQKDGKCSKQLIVNANALFGPGRWTLNPDATQTLDALAPLITNADKHPVRIAAFTRSADSDKDNQIVAEKRALTVRTWLLDRGLVPENTTMEGFAKFAPGAGSPKERVEIIIDTCKTP